MLRFKETTLQVKEPRSPLARTCTAQSLGSICPCAPQNHRIMESFGLEGTLKVI